MAKRSTVALALTAIALAGAAVTAVALTLPATGDRARIARVCDRVASPRGHHHVRGTIAGVGRLVRRLRAGETGCLRRGRYRHDVTIARRAVHLRSYPGERARLVGRLWIRRGADDVVVSHLELNGRNHRRLPSPTVNADRTTFAHVNVTNHHRGICFVLGSDHYGRAQGTVIRDSRIHDCGHLPPRNLEHGIYVAEADDTRIVGNVIADNADRGIQLFPDAQRTTIAGNVIDGNGEGIIFSGAGDVASSHNLVEHNVISNSRVRANVESYYPPGTPRGVGNVVRDNCIFGGNGAAAAAAQPGFAALDNLLTDPRYADRDAADYRMPADSECARILAAGRSERP